MSVCVCVCVACAMISLCCAVRVLYSPIFGSSIKTIAGMRLAAEDAAVAVAASTECASRLLGAHFCLADLTGQSDTCEAFIGELRFAASSV